MLTRIVIRILLFWAAANFVGAAHAVDWVCKPPRTGLALAVENPLGTNWMVERPLATINVAPEFTFPLQLFYHSARPDRGSFGDQWFCPQLESSLLPKGKDLLIWKLPSGEIAGLFRDENRPLYYSDRNGKFVAKVSGLKTTITSKDGWQYDYRNGHLELVQAPTGRQLDFVYRGSTLSQVVFRDPASNTTRPHIIISHEGRGRLTKLTIGSAVYQFTYEKGSDGRLISFNRPGIPDPEVIEYDKIGVLSGVKPPGNPPSVFKTEYAKPGRNRQLDPDPKQRKNVANYKLVDDGRLQYSYENGTVKVVDRSGVWQSFQISTARSMETSRNSAGEEIVKYYFRAPGRKHNGKLNRIEKNGRLVLQNFYDRKTGSLIESRDGNDICTYYEYSRDASLADKPIRILRSTRDGTKELQVAFQYDAAGRVIASTEPGKRVTRYRYNARGEVDAVTDPEGIVTTIKRDAQGRIISATNGDQAESLSYDDDGLLKRRQRPDGQTVEFAYDPAGKIIAVKQNGITIVQYQRDKFGSVTGKVDALGRITRLECDPKGNLVAECQPNGSVTRYEYNDAGRRIAQIDGNGNRIIFKYDTGGHLVEQKNPLGQTLTWAYDKEGRLVERTNGVQKVRNIYNDKGRLKMIDYGVPGEKVVYTYDDQGRVKRMATPTNSVTLFYDNMDRVLARQFVRGGVERVIRYSWDVTGRRTAVVLSEKEPDSKQANNYKLIQQTEYAYDGKGRLVEIKSNGASVCRYHYDVKGRLTGRQYGNGIVAKYSYDVFGRQTRLDLSGGPLLQPLLLAYQWDNAGQLLSRTWNKETQAYTYDPSGQLLTVSSAGGLGGQKIAPIADVQHVSNAPSALLESYTYDLAGNMLTKFESGKATSMSYDAANQLVSSVTNESKTAFEYDAAGRLTSQAKDGKTQSRTYGFLDKVLVLTKLDGTRMGFDYYPDGQLAAKAPLPSASDLAAQQEAANKTKTVGSIISNLLGAKPDEVSLEPNPEQATLNRNLREELIWDGLALLYRNGVSYAVEPHISGGVPLVATGADTRPVYYINDILGTTLAVVSGERVEIAPMTAFGKPKGRPGAPLADSESASSPSPEDNYLPQKNPSVPVGDRN